MLYKDSGSVSDRIVEFLSGQTATAKNIQAHLKERGAILCTSGLYKALKKLENNGVIIKTKTKFSVSNEWKKSMYDLLGQNQELSIKDGESITFNLKSASQTDKQWKHYAFLLEREALKNGLYIYNPHQFWIHVPDRAKSDEDFINYTKENNIPVYQTIGGSTFSDKDFRKIFSSFTFQVNFENISTFSHLDNITLFGDYIINTMIDNSLSKEVEAAYTNASSIQELKKLISISVNKPHRYKFKLERNHKKAILMKKRLGQHFVLL